MSAMRFITIRFTDGSTVRYSFEAVTDNKAAQQLKLEDFLKSRHLAVQSEGRLTLYPVENIRSVELSSGGASLEGVKLPVHTIRNAKLASS